MGIRPCTTPLFADSPNRCDSSWSTVPTRPLPTMTERWRPTLLVNGQTQTNKTRLIFYNCCETRSRTFVRHCHSRLWCPMAPHQRTRRQIKRSRPTMQEQRHQQCLWFQKFQHHQRYHHLPPKLDCPTMRELSGWSGWRADWCCNAV